MGVASTRRLPTRSRGLSDMPEISRRSIDYDHHAAFKSAGSSSAIQTLRQPIAPPATSALQRNDGFFRFLKQHASPPHQRVTASSLLGCPRRRQRLTLPRSTALFATGRQLQRQVIKKVI